jgi:hypothetical protein
MGKMAKVRSCLLNYYFVIFLCMFQGSILKCHLWREMKIKSTKPLFHILQYCKYIQDTTAQRLMQLKYYHILPLGDRLINARTFCHTALTNEKLCNTNYKRHKSVSEFKCNEIL